MSFIRVNTSRRATMRDVAALAGTSTAVVSYVVNDGPRSVAENTRKRVQDAIQKLDYQRNDLAKALVAGSSNTYGLVVPDISNPFFAGMAHALEAKVFAAGRTLLLGDSDEIPQRERVIVRNFLQRQVDGLIYIGSDDRAYAEQIAHAGARVVVLDRVSAESAASSVTVKNSDASRLATNHLIEHGYQQIGLLAGPATLLTARDRRAGWIEAMTAAALPIEQSHIQSGPFTKAAGVAMGTRWVETNSMPRAVFASNDQQALGLLRVAAEFNIRVPADLAIVGFDGTEDSAYSFAPLTTVRQPVELIASQAVDLLLNPAPSSPIHIQCEVELIIRQSCGCNVRSADHFGRRELNLS